MLFRELSVLGWEGVKVQPVGTGAAQLVDIGGKAADGVYMGFSGDYAGAQATNKQRELNEGMKRPLENRSTRCSLRPTTPYTP